MTELPQEVFAAVAVLVLLSCNQAAMPIWPMAKTRPWTASLASGSAAAYVFMILIPEIEVGHDDLGDNIHLITLLGFLLFYFAAFALARRGDRESKATYQFELGQAMIYQFLLVFTLHEKIPLNPLFVAVYVMGPGMHLIQQRHALADTMKRSRGLRTTFLLQGALLSGWAIGLATELSDRVIDTLTALIAGSIMLRAFKDELSARRELTPIAFFCGILITALPSVLLR